MKISLNWIFDHIKGELNRVDVPQLIQSFIKTTAEIENYTHVKINSDQLTLAEVVAIQNNNVHVYSVEHNKKYILPFRNDVSIGAWYIIDITYASEKWATAIAFGGTKDLLLPALYIAENLRSGLWKSTIELEDYIIEVDNKSINSRPDLWGHRGLAREIAAILQMPLRPLDEFLKQKDIAIHESTVSSTKHNPFSLTIKDSFLCKRFAALYIPSIVVQASSLPMVIRLSRLDSRAINFLVDVTNYVMFDLGQPMHAFDADTLLTKITVAYALPKEKIMLLDGESIELTSEDIVIADDTKAISLAGVMGGAQTSISSKTKSVLLESAHFDPVIIRRTSARHKKRTESSIRFEKNIDPYQNVEALKRFLFLLDHAGVPYEATDYILSLGQGLHHTVITIAHAFIEARLGIIISQERIVEILTKLAFEVVQSVEKEAVMYTITVPSFRATKDVKIPEDIVEEVGRSIGYDTIPRVMPALPLQPSDLQNTYTTRAIKDFLSYGLMMHELYGYSFFDESILKELSWQPTDFVSIKNPISENYTRLVTTLQPHLLKAIGENSAHYTQLRFYEWARVWHMQGEEIKEQKVLSGIFFEQGEDAKETMNFYNGKALLTRMFERLHMNIIWKADNSNNFSWCSLHQTALLMHDTKMIGRAGMIDDSAMSLFSSKQSCGFIFEINADYLLDYKRPLIRFEPLSKYPSVYRDMSILTPLFVTVDMLIATIKNVDKRIQAITLIDFFMKSEWKDQKGMTFHIEFCDKEKTLITDEVEEMVRKIVIQLQQFEVVMR